MNGYKYADEIQNIYEKAERYIDNCDYTGLYSCYVELFDILGSDMNKIAMSVFRACGIKYTSEDIEDSLQEIKINLFRKAIYNYRKSDNKERYYKAKAEKNLNEETIKNNFAAYCNAIAKNTMKNECRRRIRKVSEGRKDGEETAENDIQEKRDIYYTVESLDYITESGDEISKIETPENAMKAMLETDTKETVMALTEYMIDEVLNSHQAPQRVLALCYVRYVAILFCGENHAAPKWAYEYMNKTVGTLSETFENNLVKRYGKKDVQWCRTHTDKLNEPYQCRSGDGKVLKEIIYTQEFTRDNLRVWNDRVGDAIRKSAIDRLLGERETEMLAYLKQYKKAKDLLDGIGER